MITMVISYQDQDVWEGMIMMADITIRKHNLLPKISFPFVEDRLQMYERFDVCLNVFVGTKNWKFLLFIYLYLTHI